MLPPRTDGQRCPDCKSPHLLKFGYEWYCESCFHCSREFFAALHTWAAEFARRNSFWLRLRYPFRNRFARLAKVWPGYTEQELRDTYTAAARIYEEDKYVALGIPAREIMNDVAEWQKKEREIAARSWEFMHDPQALSEWAAELDRLQQKAIDKAIDPPESSPPADQQTRKKGTGGRPRKASKAARISQLQPIIRENPDISAKAARALLDVEEEDLSDPDISNAKKDILRR